MNSEGGNLQKAGAVSFGGTQQTALAQFELGSIGFGPMWGTEDSMAESIIRISRELEECQAQCALYEAERVIMQKRILELEAKK